MENGGSEKNRPFNILPWLAGASGYAASLFLPMQFIISSLDFGWKGMYITCEVATISAVGTATSIVGEVAVAAAVYFIPWSKLVKWFNSAWNYFLGFMEVVWRFLVDAWDCLQSFLRYPGTRVPLMPTS
jgi:hypothetical protein